MMLHLEGHHRLTCEHPDQRFYWVELSVKHERLRLLARYCRTIENRYPDGRFPYGLAYGGSGLTDSGEFLTSDGRGLTCSTFVAEVFRHQGLPLIEPATWPRGRPDDLAAQRAIVAQMKAQGADADHVAAVEREIGCARFRAEEIAAAGVSDSPPITFEQAEGTGQQIRSMILAGDRSRPTPSLVSG
jgi:hypothetical protein